MHAPSGSLEWLSSNDLGSFALGCVDRRLRRKYHSLLTVREPGKGDPWNVLAEVHERIEVDGQSEPLCDALYGNLQTAELVRFSHVPYPTHGYRVRGVDIERRVRLAPCHDQVEIHYSVRGVHGATRLSIAPILRCRGLHHVTRENPFLDGSTVRDGQDLRMLPYAGMPGLAMRVKGAQPRWAERGTWYRGVHYAWEAERGYEATEDLFGPGEWVFELTRDTELTLLVALDHCVDPEPSVEAHVPASFGAKLERAASQFLMRTRNGTHTVIAGYPWFSAWSRDTLIALPGLHLACLDFERTASILEGLLAARVNGLIPNIPALGDEAPNTSSVDATLLFVRAVQWLKQHEGRERVLRFMPAVCELLEALADGRDPRMRLDQGVGVWTQRGPWALTWMDAMVDGSPVTPRAGYAVDIDALAYNAAHFALEWAEVKRPLFARALRTRLRDGETRFLARYWDDTRGFLADGHDGERPDAALRPNQLWALGLPYRPVPENVARACLATVTRELLTPAGLRTLSPRDSRYRAHYAGTQTERDLAYHQGTVWPFLLGIYADAVLSVRGREALDDVLSPVLSFHAQHIDHDACLGQVSEVFSGDPPHLAGGAPAQAWSVAEIYRVYRLLHSPMHTGTPTDSFSTQDMLEKRQ